MTKQQALEKLWAMGHMCEVLLDENQKEVVKHYYENPEQTLVFSIARQAGKCIKSGTYIATPSGPVKIEELKKDDIVYGFNKDGTVSPTKVLDVFCQGIKKVVDLKHRGRVVASATKDHRWGGYDTFAKRLRETNTDEVLRSSHIKIARRYVDVPGGNVHEPHAYTLGALLGDGYSSHNNGTYQTVISSQTDEIPRAIAEEIGCFYWKQKGKNYNWLLCNYENGNSGSIKDRPYLIINHFNEWCRNRLAHEKTCDLKEILSWTRQDQIRFIAGLLDTDGSIFVVGRQKNELKFSLAMQAKDVIDVVKFLFLSLWQIELCYQIDDRDKYKNGPVHIIYSNNNFCVKRALKEISPHLALSRKQYKPEYDAFPDYNHVADYCGVIAGDEYEAETWDISVDNETHLYLLANGLVTHNSFSMLALADQECRRNPNFIVTYVAATQKQAKKIARIAMREIFATCPPNLKPDYKTQEGIFKYANGSEIEILGNNGGRIEDARGPKSHLIICDEVGFWTDLDYAIKSVLGPRLNSTKGKMVLISTPPRSAAHPFYRYVKDAEQNKALVIKTIYDCPRYTEADIEKFAKQCGGFESNEFKREYLTQFIVDTDYVVFPEATDELLMSITGISERPPYFDAYVSCDWGTRDKTAMLFAYWDFRKNKLYIEDEIVISGNETRSDLIATFIYNKEAELWQTDPKEKYTPYTRVSDTDLRLLNDLNSIHDLAILPTSKDNREAAINEVRMMLKNEQIIINPKCKQLLFDLQNATWNKTRTDYERSKQHGHNDSGSALVYMVRNLHRNRNPYPPGYDLNITSNTFVSQHYKPENTDLKDGIKKMFTPKSTMKRAR